MPSPKKDTKSRQQGTHLSTLGGYPQGFNDDDFPGGELDVDVRSEMNKAFKAAAGELHESLGSDKGKDATPERIRELYSSVEIAWRTYMVGYAGGFPEIINNSVARSELSSALNDIKDLFEQAPETEENKAPLLRYKRLLKSLKVQIEEFQLRFPPLTPAAPNP